MKKIPLLRWQYFFWVPVMAALFLIWLAFGTPYFIWSYSWIDHGQGQDPFANRYYTQCNYLKLTDVSKSHIVRSPSNGKCSLLAFPNRGLSQ